MAVDVPSLKLLAVFLQHTDTKTEQQRLLCVDEPDLEHPQRCQQPLLMLDDVGLTFGGANFINNNPTVVMLALGFLLMIGMTLIAEGMGAHVPKGYIYAAMAFSALIEGLNMLARRARKRVQGASTAKGVKSGH